MTLVQSIFLHKYFPYFERLVKFNVLKSNSNKVHKKFREVSYFDPLQRTPIVYDIERLKKDSNRERVDPIYLEPRRNRGTVENPIVVTHMLPVINAPCFCRVEDNYQIILYRNNRTQCPSCKTYYYLMKGETNPNLTHQYDESYADKAHPERLEHRHLD